MGNFEVGAKVIPPPSCDEGFVSRFDAQLVQKR